MKRAFFLILALATALVACNKNESTPAEQTGGRVIRFTSNFSTYTVTKAASVLDGKTVKIFAGAPINASTEAEANDGQLTPATTLHWLDGQTDPTTFASVYPAEVGSATSFEYDLSNGDFTYHSAVLAAAAKDVAPENVVNFTYKHPFAMLKVSVNNNLTGTPAIAGVTVGDVVGSATMDIAAETVSNPGAAAVIPATLDNGKYCVVLMPQTAKPAILVNVGDDTSVKTYKFLITSDVTFEANKFYNVALTLDESTPPVVEGAEVAFGFTVSDWEEVTDEIPVVNVTEQWSVIGEVNDTAWDTDFDMTFNATTGIFTITGVQYKEGSMGFKLRKAHDWTVNAGMKPGVSYVGEAAWDGYLDGDSNQSQNIKLAAAGEYTLTFKPEDYTFTATKTGDVVVDPTPAATWGLIGSFNDWSADIAMTCTTPGTNPADGVWEVDFTYVAGDSFKLRYGASWDDGNYIAGLKYGVEYVGDTAWDGYLDLPGDNIKLSAAGTYHLVFTYPSCTFTATLIVDEP